MRLRSVFISNYKTLKDFELRFEGNGFIDIFVGSNGSGKSNLLEALIEIFDHIYGFKTGNPGPGFDYAIAWDIAGNETTISWRNGQLSINGTRRKQIGKAALPSNIIVYYSGQNDTVASLIRRYRESYRRNVKKAIVAESPRFIGIGPDYKTLLVALMLMLPTASKARRFLCEKLGIEVAGGTTWLKLRRPSTASKTRSYDPFNDVEIFWGIKGIARQFLDQLMDCIIGDFTPGSLYSRESDTYRIEIDISKFRETFSTVTADEVFCLFNALRALGMIEDISIPLRLAANAEVSSRAFSDGQFQSVYLFAISELFKSRNCITLLDEPDAFLHPEWQSDFLGQTHAISQEGTRTNHILMTTHSASTVAAKVESNIRKFEFSGEKTEVVQRSKAEIIKSLSAGLITFSASEARLNIKHNLKNVTGPVLFTEGVSDEIILETAWEKLNPGLTAPFAIQSAFSASFLRVLLSDQTLYDEHPDRSFFGLFDFDDAYNSWNIQGVDIELDPERCLTRKRNNCEGYSMLLPVPAGLSIRDQVINPTTGQHYKSEARLSIELLFRDVPGLDANFEVDPTRPGGCIRFKGKKTRFASQVVPTLDAEYFEGFRPIFNFVQGAVAVGAPS
ncbi:AAA family ATPase [Mesorhizobium intechi]|uniref:AAA family ATPase n=1 Tax=Mesorhizobium intechi TaxID=537601 RepID=A0A8T9ALY7_9HYPH|nr:AAA family ATPase [Mesorhizobium intechi]TSE04057.1 AAA family ATPase [Mesorhizobium intechi]